MAERFRVEAANVWGTKVPMFKAVGFNGVGVNYPVESKATEDKAEAQDWADRAEAGEQVPEAGFASYSDD